MEKLRAADKIQSGYFGLYNELDSKRVQRIIK